MFCCFKTCDGCHRRCKRVEEATSTCTHYLCPVCYTEMVIASDRECRKWFITYRPICPLCKRKKKKIYSNPECFATTKPLL